MLLPIQLKSDDPLWRQVTHRLAHHPFYLTVNDGRLDGRHHPPSNTNRNRFTPPFKSTWLTYIGTNRGQIIFPLAIFSLSPSGDSAALMTLLTSDPLPTPTQLPSWAANSMMHYLFLLLRQHPNLQQIRLPYTPPDLAGTPLQHLTSDQNHTYISRRPSDTITPL